MRCGLKFEKWLKKRNNELVMQSFGPDGGVWVTVNGETMKLIFHSEDSARALAESGSVSSSGSGSSRSAKADVAQLAALFQELKNSQENATRQIASLTQSQSQAVQVCKVQMETLVDQQVE